MFSRCLSWETIDLQCLLVMCGRDGSLGSKLATKVGRFVVSCLKTHLRASSLGIALALAIAPSMTPGVYSLSSNISFNSLNLFSLAIFSLQVLFILMPKLNGIEFVHSMG